MWKYNNPVKIYFTENFIDTLKATVDLEKRSLLICSKRFTNTPEFKLIKDFLKEFDVYTDIETEPSLESCGNAITAANKYKSKEIIAIGGGSVIDTAKAVRLSLMTNIRELELLFKESKTCGRNIKFIAIPTTHGTSSELTKWATIWNKIEKKKYSLSHDKNYPDYAIYDYHFVQNLPLDISLITTLDALSHSFEALWNRNANPISDKFAIHAIKLIFENIDKIAEDTSIEIRKLLLQANMYSGLAFSNTKTAAAHSISYPLTAHYGIPHGIACSMTLKKIFQLNSPFIPNKVSKLIKELTIPQMNTFWDDIDGCIKGKIKYSLNAFGIKEDELDKLVNLCFTKGRMDNNIKELTRTDVKEILEESLLSNNSG